MALILNSRTWQDKDNFLPAQTIGILSGAFAEEKILTLDYSFDQTLNDCEVYFNPALFIEQGILLEQSQTLPPNISYWYKVTTATVAGVENTMNLLNSNATERNMSVTFELNADRLSFKIRLTCFLTSDILEFLNDNGIDNSIRLLGNTKDADELENLEDSVYNSDAKGFGIHTGVKVPKSSELCGTKASSGADGIKVDTYIADGELFTVRFKPLKAIDKLEIFVNGVLTASSGTQPGNNFGAVDGFDGNAGAGYPLGSHPNPPVIPSPNRWYMGGAVSYDNRLSDFTTDTGLTANLGGFQQIIWVNCEAGDTIEVRVAGSQGTLWEYEVYCPQPTASIDSKYEYADAWINSEFLFLNEGTMTNPVFELSRNSEVVNDFATFEDTDVTLRIDHTSTISNAKVWVIDADNTTQSLDFKKAYGYQPTNYFSVPVPSNLGGNTYETNFVIDKTKLNLAGRYFIIAVYYDAANEYVASYISDSIFVTEQKLYTPSITGTIYNLIADFFSNYIETSPLQRLCAEIRLDKYAGFDSAYLGGVLNIGGESISWFGKNNQGDFTFSDSSEVLIIRYYFRVKEEWANSEIDIKWNINFNVEFTTIKYPQKISVIDFEQNRATPNLTEIKLYKDGVQLLEEGDSACDANFLRVETIKTAESVNYAQAAIWKDEIGNIYEEEAWSPISVFTQSSNAFQSNVEIQFDSQGAADDVNHNITNEVHNGKVGIIAYPPPLPISFIRHPFHNTIYTGRNTVFIAEYDSGAGKSFAAINGITSDDFLFRVGDNTTSTDANSNDWAAYSDLTFAQFSALSITAGQRVMVRYTGTQTDIVNIVGYIEMRFGETVTNPKTIQFTALRQIAASDVMLFTGQNVQFTGALITSATVKSKNRSFAEVSDNQNLLSYDDALTGVPTPNIGLVPHLYFTKTSNSDSVINVTVNNISSSSIEIGNPATALRNEYYSVTGDGTNSSAIINDRVNDIFDITSVETLDKFSWNGIQVGETVNLEATFRYNFQPGVASCRLITTLNANSNSEFGLICTGGGIALFWLTGPLALIGVGGLINYIVGRVYKVSVTFKKVANSGLPENCIENLSVCVNGSSENGTQFQTGTIPSTWANEISLTIGTNRYSAAKSDRLRSLGFSKNNQDIALNNEDFLNFYLSEEHNAKASDELWVCDEIIGNIIENTGQTGTTPITLINNINELRNIY